MHGKTGPRQKITVLLRNTEGVLIFQGPDHRLDWVKIWEHRKMPAFPGSGIAGSTDSAYLLTNHPIVTLDCMHCIAVLMKVYILLRRSLPTYMLTISLILLSVWSHLEGFDKSLSNR